jgi:hypothetical protein
MKNLLHILQLWIALWTDQRNRPFPDPTSFDKVPRFPLGTRYKDAQGIVHIYVKKRGH